MNIKVGTVFKFICNCDNGRFKGKTAKIIEINKNDKNIIYYKCEELSDNIIDRRAFPHCCRIITKQAYND